MSLSSEDVLFVGKGTGVVPWYRTGMPAFALGCDWVGMVGEPPILRVDTSRKRGGHSMPELEKYKIIVLQQVHGRAWHDEIIRLRGLGIKVIYEVDDYLHGVRNIMSHRAKDVYSDERLPQFELCMRACDAMIVSTRWLAKRYSAHNPTVFVCKNGIEARRYSKFRLPKRKTINIGWAGGEGHLEAVRAWLPAVENILEEFSNARFISLGLPVGALIRRPRQSIALPFISIENFPGALTNFDIAIAPAGRNEFYAGKSDLRFLETGALGIPLVADPFVYDDIMDGQTGLYADTPAAAERHLRRLVRDRELRNEIGYSARDYVLTNRSIERAVDQWENVFKTVYREPRVTA